MFLLHRFNSRKLKILFFTSLSMNGSFCVGNCCKYRRINILDLRIFYFFFQLLFYCHYGTLLYEEVCKQNNTLINAVYMGDWYRYDVKIRTILLTIMEGSKRPMTFTAGAVVDVTLETFVSVGF